MKRVIRGICILSLIFLFAFIVIHPSQAGMLKGKIQQRLNTPSNIQYEPYYMDQDQSRVDKEENILSPAQEFTKTELKEQMASRNAGIPSVLSRYAIYQTYYQAELEENVVTVHGKIIFQVFDKGWTQIPLARTDVGLIDVSVNRGAAFVTMLGNKYYLMMDKPGRYTANIEYLIKASREREFGPGSFRFDVVSAPISQYEFTINESGVDIFVEPAIKVEVDKEKEKTVAWAIMPNTTSITTRWTKALPKEKIQQVQLEPKVYADTATYASVGEGIVRCQTQVNYSILQSEVSSFRLVLPQDVSLLNVTGKDLRDWKVTEFEAGQYLDVYLNFGIKGNFILHLTYERNIGEGSVVASIPSVKTLGVEREHGYFGIAAKTNVELATRTLEKVTPLDVKQLPSSIWGRSTNPILLAFKYLKHPFNITIDVTRHEELSVLVAAVDSANFVTLYTDEGKVLTKAVYHVRNNVKQFLRLDLPKEAVLWSTFVAGKPVKPAKDKNGSVLVPLEKSKLQGQTLTRFPVEIVYLDKGAKMNFLGQLKVKLPFIDIPISEMNWSLYCPLDFVYFNFGGNVKPLKSRSRLRPAVQISRGIQGRLRSSADDIGDQFWGGNEQMAQKSEGRAKGLLPIKIDIPQRGQLMQFSKLLVTEKESPWVRLNYLGISEKTRGMAWLVFILAILFFVLKFFKRIFRRRKKES